MWNRSCHMYNISSIKESRWSQSLSKYQIVYKAILRHNSETIETFNQNLIVNDIFCHLFPTDRIFFNKVMISSRKKTFLKDKMMHFFKNPWFNTATLWIVRINTATSSIAYEVWNRNSKRGSGCVHVVLSRCGKLVMAKLKSFLLS